VSAFYCGDSNVEVIKTQFVPVAIDSYLRGSNDERAMFQLVGVNNFQYFAASGKPLGGKVESDNLANMKKALNEFKYMPEEDRKPKIAGTAKISANSALPTPPPGCLIVAVYTTYLDRDEKANYSRAERYFTEIYYGSSVPVRPALTNLEMLWITEAEWKAMIPQNPVAGSKIPMPASLQRRILLLHAQDYKGNERNPSKRIREGTFTLTVTRASADMIALRLDGLALTGADFDDYSKSPLKTGQGSEGEGKQGADLLFQGALIYDLKKKAFTRFDIVALGDAWGEFTNRYRGAGMNGKPKNWPIGIAFELVTGDRPVNRVPPLAACPYRAFDYFGSGNRTK
jgi:hypothetical protein